MKCICCDADAVVARKPLRGYPMCRCTNCSFEFVHPLPSVADIEAFYNKTRVSGDLKKIIREYITDFDKGGQAPKRDWFNKVLADAKKYTGKNTLNIFEIGSGYGYFVHYAASREHHVTGTEVTASYAEAGNAVVGNIVYTPDGNYDDVIADNWADLIYMEHVFEHVLDPEAIISQVKKKISPSGIFFLSVPNNKSFLARVMGAKWPWACPPDHLYFYNRKALSEFLNRHGFEVLEAYTGDYYFRSIPQLYSFTPYINFLRKKTGMKRKGFAYRYPQRVGDILNLLPYWVLRPFLKMGGKDTGNELIMIARPKKT